MAVEDTRDISIFSTFLIYCTLCAKLDIFHEEMSKEWHSLKERNSSQQKLKLQYWIVWMYSLNLPSYQKDKAVPTDKWSVGTVIMPIKWSKPK